MAINRNIPPDVGQGIVVDDPETVEADEYEELLGSPTESLETKTFTAQRKLVCDWANRHLLAVKIMGKTTLELDGTITHQRARPYPWLRGVFAQRVQIEPFTPDSDGSKVATNVIDPNALEYEKALLTIDYSSDELQGSGSNDNDDPNTTSTYVTESIEPFVEFVTMASSKRLYWDFPSKILVKDAEAPGRPVSGFNWNYKIHRMPRIPPEMLQLTDKINEKALKSLTLQLPFEAKTLLFRVNSIEREITSEGFGAWSIGMKLSFRRFTWEKFFRPGYQEPQFMYDSDGVQFKPFEYGDFTSIMSGIPEGT